MYTLQTNPRVECPLDPSCLYPLNGASDLLLRHCKLSPHTGVGKVASHGESHPPSNPVFEMFKRLAKPASPPSEYEFEATALHPAAGIPLIILKGPKTQRFSRNVGEGLTVRGESPDGEFELHCARFYTREVSGFGDDPAWAIAVPWNGPAIITYGERRRVASVHALINNFDFEYGNVVQTNHDQEVLRVEAGGKVLAFRWRDNHDELRLLVGCEVFRTTALTELRFDAWTGASDEDLSAFAWNVSSLCSIAAKQHTGIPVLSLLDAEERVVKRIIGDAIESPYRRRGIFADPHLDTALPQLFRECFEEHVRMRGSDLWSRMPALCASIEDSTYLEQKVASLMAAIEALIRSALVEAGCRTSDESESMTFPHLVGAAKSLLRWEVPKHYTRGERHRVLRNAVAHGNELPFDVADVRGDFDKWHLFLLRRLLMRLGFTGTITSPQNGWVSTSLVGDFSEDHNSFGA